MRPERIAELLSPFLQADCLTARQLQHISTYIDILLRWNARINLTAVRDEEQVVTRHFGESLFAARNLFPLCNSVPSVVKGLQTDEAGECREEAKDFRVTDDGIRDSHRRAALQGRVGAGQAGALAPVSVADIGSGAGFPGIPLKIWAPQITLTLIESNHKKATFLREVARALTLTDINIQNTRAESIDARFDLVTLRAVERFEAVLPVAANLVAPHGRLALLIGWAQVPPARSIAPDLKWFPPVPIPQSQSRVLFVGTSGQGSHSTHNQDS